MPVH
jgi:F-type H+-transporting ATPase subunit gamma